jgi:hypothetical protein
MAEEEAYRIPVFSLILERTSSSSSQNSSFKPFSFSMRSRLLAMSISVLSCLQISMKAAHPKPFCDPAPFSFVGGESGLYSGDFVFDAFL